MDKFSEAKTLEFLALIPARSGSKGIKNKNLKKIQNKSLTKLAFIFCKNLSFVNEIFISTDDKKILNKISVSKFNLNNLRSAKNSSDKSKIKNTIMEVINLYEKKNIFFKNIILIEPTSPLRKILDVKNAYKKFIKNKLTSLWTVNKVDLHFHPLKQFYIKKKKIKYFKKNNVINRQSLKSTYIRNGVAYFINTNAFKKENKLLTKNNGFYICKNMNISIDTPKDLKLARKFYGKNV